MKPRDLANLLNRAAAALETPGDLSDAEKGDLILDLTVAGGEAGTPGTLTPEQKKEYLEKGGQHCPYCHSTDIEGGTLDAEWNEAWAEVTCKNCGETWQDEYKLVDITEEGEN